jgi:hypothetical protein
MPNNARPKKCLPTWSGLMFNNDHRATPQEPAGEFDSADGRIQ